MLPCAHQRFNLKTAAAWSVVQRESTKMSKNKSLKDAKTSRRAALQLADESPGGSPFILRTQFCPSSIQKYWFVPRCFTTAALAALCRSSEIYLSGIWHHSAASGKLHEVRVRWKLHQHKQGTFYTLFCFLMDATSPNIDFSILQPISKVWWDQSVS